MKLHERRAQADHAANDAAFRGARLHHRLAALREHAEPHRASLTVAAGLLAGMLTSLLPLRHVMRAAMLGMDGFLLFARLLPQRNTNAPVRASDRIPAVEPVRDA